MIFSDCKPVWELHPLDEPQKMGGDATQTSLEYFNLLFCLNYSVTHYVLAALDALNKRLVKKIQVKGFEVKNLRGTDSYLYLENIITSPKHLPMARLELEIAYDKSINRELRKVGVSENLYYLFNRMEQYKDGYVITEIDPFNGGRISFQNGVGLTPGQVTGDVSERNLRRIQIRETILGLGQPECLPYLHSEAQRQHYPETPGSRARAAPLRQC